MSLSPACLKCRRSVFIKRAIGSTSWSVESSVSFSIFARVAPDVSVTLSITLMASLTFSFSLPVPTVSCVLWSTMLDRNSLERLSKSAGSSLMMAQRGRMSSPSCSQPRIWSIFCPMRNCLSRPFCATALSGLISRACWKCITASSCLPSLAHIFARLMWASKFSGMSNMALLKHTMASSGHASETNMTPLLFQA